MILLPRIIQWPKGQKRERGGGSYADPKNFSVFSKRKKEENTELSEFKKHSKQHEINNFKG